MNTNPPNISQIQKYLNGELDIKAMHQLEQQAQDDPFLMDALEGYQNIGTNQQYNLIDMQSRLARRTTIKNTRNVLLWALPMAASVVAALVAGLLWLSPKGGKEKTALNKSYIKKSPIKTDTTQNAPLGIAPTPYTTGIKKPIAQLQHISLNQHRSVPAQLIAVANTNANKKKSFTQNLNNDTVTAQLQSPQALAEVIPGLGITKPLTGIVMDTAGHALSGVKVYVKGTNIAAVTDSKGVFNINSTSPKQTLTIDYAGYDNKQIVLNGQDKLNITLNESAVSLPEISIPSHSDSKSAGLANVQPLDGWKNYRAYIRKNAVMPNGEIGRVKLTFTIRADGSITNIKVRRGRTDAMNLKAIDLIKNGPEWRGDVEAREIRIKIKFHKGSKV